MIRSIKLQNFKTFRQSHVIFGAFNVVVGANASGKSNLLQALHFIGDVGNHGLENAVALQAGFSYLKSLHASANEPLSLELETDREENFMLPISNEKRSEKPSFDLLECRTTGFKHTLMLNGSSGQFQILRDKVSCTFKVNSKGTHNGVVGSLDLTNNAGKVKTNVAVDSPSIKLERYFLDMVRRSVIEPLSCIAFMKEPLALLPIPREAGSGEGEIAYYDFDPRLSKQAVRISGAAELQESGDNLSIVLQKILADPKQRRRLFSRIKDLLPFVSKLDLEHFSDRSVMLKLGENYTSEVDFPASLVSNGTVSIVATLVAVLFQPSATVVLEEPERNIHPYLVQRLLETIRDASTQRQIIISTHSPTILDNCDLKELLLVTRDRFGTSSVSKPIDSSAVKSFIEHEFTAGRLHESKLLEL